MVREKALVVESPTKDQDTGSLPGLWQGNSKVIEDKTHPISKPSLTPEVNQMNIDT